MKRAVIPIALAGIGIVVALVAWYGIDDVGHAIRLAGWRGLGALTLFQLFSIIVSGFAWWVIPFRAPGQGWTFFVWARWLRDGVGNVLALLPASSEVVGARVLTTRGTGGTGAAASVVVDMTAELVSQVLFTAGGVLLLFAYRPDSPVSSWGAIGLALAVPVTIAFVIAQRAGLFRLIGRITERLAAGLPHVGAQWGHELHDRIEAIYRHPWRFALGIVLHLGGWLLAAGGIWIGLRYLGQPLPFAEALVIESVVYAMRNVAFFVPWGAGVQEGGYVILGALFGVAPGTALALALLKRGRDIVLGVPAAANWLLVERSQLRRRRPAPTASEKSS